MDALLQQLFSGLSLSYQAPTNHQEPAQVAETEIDILPLSSPPAYRPPVASTTFTAADIPALKIKREKDLIQTRKWQNNWVPHVNPRHPSSLLSNEVPPNETAKDKHNRLARIRNHANPERQKRYNKTWKAKQKNEKDALLGHIISTTVC